MAAAKSDAPRQVIGEGSTQLLCETFVNIKPPMSNMTKELYDVEITDYTLFNDKVIFIGNAKKTFYYNHPHFSRKSSHSKSSNKKESSSSASSTSDKQSDEFKCLDGWGQLVDSYGGTTHFHNQFFEFKGTVVIPGVMPGDSVEVEKAEIIECHPFEATSIDEDNGLIHAGRQMFKINVVLKATRCQCENGIIIEILD